MKLLKIKCNNLWQFKGLWEINLGDINFFRGRNGVGKTNFALGIFSYVVLNDLRQWKLTDLPTKGVKKEETWGEVEIEHNGDTYNIHKKVPTEITILKNGQNIDPEDKLSITDKLSFLNEHFKSADYFKKFRLIDAYDNTGKTNFLEKSDITIKKVLFSNTEDKLNEVRQNFLDSKTEREKYNVDEAILYHCFPSQKRLDILKKAREELDDKIELIDEVIDEFERRYRDRLTIRSELEGNKQWITKYKNKIESYNICPTCKRPITNELKEELLADKVTQLQDITIRIIDLNEEIKKYNNKVTAQRDKKDILYDKKSPLGELIMKLKSRIHSKDYRFSNRDVVIVKEAIKELDTISSEILKNNVKVLEPIINDVLKPINHTINFDVNEKGKFKMELTDSKGNVWSYKQLSTGQKLMVQIAIKLAILLEQGEEGVMIADEGMGALDYSNLMHIIEIFSNLPFQLNFILHGLDNIPGNVNIIDLDKEFARRKNGTKKVKTSKTKKSKKSKAQS